jgi:Ca2+:H+ antiporter
MTTDDFTRAVAVATVSALRHQQQTAVHNPARIMRHSGADSEAGAGGAHGGGHGGHDAPSWSRSTSASVLLGCTALYAVIAGEHLSFCLFCPGTER